MIFENAPAYMEFSVSAHQMHAVAPHQKLRTQNDDRHIERRVHAEQRLHDGVADVADVAVAEQKAHEPRSASGTRRSLTTTRLRPMQQKSSAKPMAMSIKTCLFDIRRSFPMTELSASMGFVSMTTSFEMVRFPTSSSQPRLPPDKPRRHREEQHKHFFNQRRNVHMYLFSCRCRARTQPDAAEKAL